MVLYYLVSAFKGRFRYEYRLYAFLSHPGYKYSDMNGFGHFLMPVVLFDLYWAAFAVLLTMVGSLLWVRGLEVRAKRRLTQAYGRFSVRLRTTAAYVLLGSVIFYSTNVVNEYRTRLDDEARQANYEKQYKQYEQRAQPRITDVKVNVDVFPSRRKRRFHFEGQPRRRKGHRLSVLHHGPRGSASMMELSSDRRQRPGSNDAVGDSRLILGADGDEAGFWDDKMQRFLRHELGKYLMDRGMERKMRCHWCSWKTSPTFTTRKAAWSRTLCKTTLANRISTRPRPTTSRLSLSSDFRTQRRVNC